MSYTERRQAIRQMREGGCICRVRTPNKTLRISAPEGDVIEEFLIEQLGVDDAEDRTIDHHTVCYVLNEYDFRVVKAIEEADQ